MLPIVAALTVAAGASAVSPRFTAAATTEWMVTASPTTLTEGQTTSVTLTVTDLAGGPKIGTVLVSIPAGFTVIGASAPSPWLSAMTQVGPPALVQFNVTSDPQRLSPVSSVDLVITVRATTTPVAAWTVTSYQKSNTSSTQNAAPTSSLAPFVILPAPTPTPAPTPALTPAPTATPAPTSTATLAPGATPTAAPSSTAGGSSPAATLAPGWTPGPSGDPATSPSPGSTLAAAGEPSSGPHASPLATAAPPGGALLVGGSTGGSSGSEVSFGSLGPLDFAFDWLIPGFVVALPGLLIVLLVLIQAGAGVAWLPIVRRELGDFGLRRRHRGPGDGEA